MAIEYKVIERNVIGGPGKGSRKFYASSSTTGVTTLEVLTKEIERISTVSGADIQAVLYALLEIIPDHLAAGNTVKLGELGSFRVSISSKGEDSADQVGTKSIQGGKILFTAGKKFRQILGSLTYKKSS